jgi:glutamine amidotransferase
MSVAIVDYGSGNLRSAAKAFERAAAEQGTPAPILVTSDPETIATADRLVLPGVGAFKDCRDGLDAAGVAEALTHAVRARGVPFLGICVGMQLLASRGLEHETTEGLGWIAGDVVRFDIDPALRIPHMGWNTLEAVRPHPILGGIALGPGGLHAYFVHSYVIRSRAAADIVATSDYGGPFAAVVGRDNIVGTQFHPEKSQALGLALIGNFLRWSP